MTIIELGAKLKKMYETPGVNKGIRLSKYVEVKEKYLEMF